MKPIDMLGLGPTRDAVKDGDGWLVTVIPPAWSGFGPNSIRLTEEQYIRYLDWLLRGQLIHECLPDLSDAERETLMTGIGEQQWDGMK